MDVQLGHGLQLSYACAMCYHACGLLIRENHRTSAVPAGLQVSVRVQVPRRHARAVNPGIGQPPQRGSKVGAKAASRRSKACNTKALIPRCIQAPRGPGAPKRGSHHFCQVCGGKTTGLP